MKTDVSAGVHLTHFPERQVFWDGCARSEPFKDFVHALLLKYVSLVRGCCKGKLKYAKFLVEWMELQRVLLHEPTPPSDLGGASAQARWVAVLQTVDSPSPSTKSGVLTSVMRAVFNFCQQKVVSKKEGGTLLLEVEQDDDPMEEAGHDADEASLYRLGGFALFSALKMYAKYSGSVSEKIHEVLTKLQLPSEEKNNLPANIVYLDKGNMTFMRKELLGFLSKVCMYTGGN